MDIFNCNKDKTGRLLIFFIVSLLGIGDAVSQPVVSVPEAMSICPNVTGNDGKALGACILCLTQSSAASASTDCKPYLHLKDAIPPKPAVVITPAEIDKGVAALMDRCGHKALWNCQCMEKEYRADRAKGLKDYEAASNTSSACVSEEKIKAFEYAQCVKPTWNRFVEFESYCNCVADYIATETKKGWSVGVTPKTLRRPAPKACGYAKLERLSSEAAKERYKKYGSRGPTYDPSTWRNLL